MAALLSLTPERPHSSQIATWLSFGTTSTRFWVVTVLAHTRDPAILGARQG